MIIFRIFLITLFFICDYNTAALASSGVMVTKIKSNFIDVSRKDETVDLSGNVVIEREDLNVLADKMRVYYTENKTDKDNTIKKIEAEDNVKIFSNEFIATGNSGYYNPKENNFILEKNVIFNNGTSVAHGERFIYDLKTRKGKLVGQKMLLKNNNKKNNNTSNDGRVTVIIDDNDIPKSKK